MAERVSIKEEMTSGEAGLTFTRFECRRRVSLIDFPMALGGSDLPFLSLSLGEVRETLLSGMLGGPELLFMLPPDIFLFPWVLLEPRGDVRYRFQTG